MPGDDPVIAHWDFTGIKSVTYHIASKHILSLYSLQRQYDGTLEYKKISKQYDTLKRTQGLRANRLPAPGRMTALWGPDLLIH